MRGGAQDRINCITISLTRMDVEICQCPVSSHKPPWPNGQGVGLLIRRLRVRVPQGVHLPIVLLAFLYLSISLLARFL